MTIGDLILRVLADTKQFSSDLQRNMQKEGDKAGKTLGAKMSGGLKGAFKGSKGDLLGMIGLGAGIGVATVGISKLIGVMGDSITAASNLAEAESKVGVVFADSTAKVREWGKTSAEAMGLSERGALEAAGTIGNLLLSMGKTTAEAAEMSMEMVQLAADLGSFNNVGTEEVLMAIRSGLTGEIAPLRRFGVNLTEAALKQKALSMGLSDGKGVLDATTKSSAAYALILEQTTTAQGDFARTADGLANTQRSLGAAWEDAQAALGEALLPVMIEVVQFVRDEFIPAVKDIGEALATMDEGAADNADALGNLSNLLHDLFKEPQEDARTFLGSLFDGMNSVLELASDINDAWTFWDTYESHADEAARATAELAETAREGGRGIGVAESAAAAAGPVIEEMGDQGKEAGRKLKRAAHEAGEAFLTWRDRVIGAARDVIDQAYQIIDDRAELSAVNIEQAELRKAMATGKATSEQKARYDELNQRQVELLVDLAANGVTSGKLVSDTMNRLRDRLKTATGQERVAILEAIRLENKLAAAAERAALRISTANALAKLGLGSQGLIGGNWGPTGHASGGIRQAGVPSWVGERGKELSIPLTPSLIIPHEQSMDLASGLGTTYNVVVNNPEPRAADTDISRMLRRVAVLG